MARSTEITLLLFLALSSGLNAQQPAGREVSWVRLVPNIASDQKQIWLSPAKLARGKRWLPVIGVAGITAALIETDARTGRYFRRTDTFQGFNSAFTGNVTFLLIGAAPALLYALGAVRHDSYARQTALLAGEAVANAEILTSVLKDIGRRRRPAAYGPDANLSDSWFSSHGDWIRGNGSFPSGHAIAAFSVATVLSRRYPKHRWLPYVAYGLSAVVGFSRMTLCSHFASDVFLGGALGYSIGRFAVLRQ